MLLRSARNGTARIMVYRFNLLKVILRLKNKCFFDIILYINMNKVLTTKFKG